MASPCRIVTDSEELARSAEQLVHQLESRWTRFRPTSEVSAVNAAAGHLVVVSDLTARLFELAEFARVATGGRFNPLMLDHLERLGYGPGTASPEDLRETHHTRRPVADSPIDVLAEVSAVRLPEGSRFDPGGIGKGLAADVVLDHLKSLGARAAQIELGGDVRMWGTNWTDQPWLVDVQDPRDRIGILTRLELAEGAVATSSVLGRNWTVGGQRMHHLIDPSTGLPSETDVLSVTTTSSELWWAEIVAKVAVLAGSRRAPSVMQQFGCSGVVLDRNGTLVSVTADHSVAGETEVLA